MRPVHRLAQEFGFGIELLVKGPGHLFISIIKTMTAPIRSDIVDAGVVLAAVAPAV